ncbi:MAG: hypothetical protein ACLP1Q_21310 [Solirubrobacteraceae bacterium]
MTAATDIEIQPGCIPHLEMFPEHPVYSWLLKHGRVFEHKPKPAGVGLRMARPRNGKGDCFGKSLDAACADKSGRFIYCEGVAEMAHVGMVTEHAWLLDTTDGRAVDLTWSEPAREYFGVAIETRAACRIVIARGWNGVLEALHDPHALDGCLFGGER